MVRRIDFDFEKLKSPKGASISLPTRAKHLYNWTGEFLATNPELTDCIWDVAWTAAFSGTHPPPSIRWYDVDFPDVIEVRKRLYPDATITL